MENILEIRNLTKKYDSKTAVDNISFSVKEGSCFGLLGPNGAGKSSTMKIVTGIIGYDSGTVKVFGIDGKQKRDEIKLKTGYVPQEITIYETLSAYNNLHFFGELYGMRGHELKKRIHEVLEQVGLADHSESIIKTFSGGMKRRINMAAALLHKPKLLILDEPTVGIDPQSRNHIFEMIKELKKQGVTIIYSTHYMEEVETLCDEITIVDHGKLIAKGPLIEIIDKYAPNSIYIEAEAIAKAPVYSHSLKVYPKEKGWIIESDHIIETIQEITTDALNKNIKIKELGIVRPSLESVFLSLTGTSLRD